VPLARHWATQRCAAHLDDNGLQVVELLTTELVANAVLHGQPPLVLEVDSTPGQLHVAVTDANLDPPLQRKAGPDATGGRGIALIAALATAWGYRPSPLGGKIIWFCYAQAG